MIQAVQDLPPGDEPVGKIVGREALAIAAAAVLYPFGLRHSRRRTPRQAEQRTVVLVHGYLANKSCFTALRTYLRLGGHRQVLAYGYRASDSVESAAVGLKAFLRKHVRGGRIDLVCHSLGGLVALSYLAELGGARRVDRCITLGTPHQGTYNAYWITGRMARDLRPDSLMIKRLNAARAATGSVAFTAIVGASDNIILPRVFAAQQTDTIVIRGVGHTGMLFSPSVFRAVSDRLGRLVRGTT